MRLKPGTSISRDREPVLRVLMRLPGLVGSMLLVRVDFGRKLFFRLASANFHLALTTRLPRGFPDPPPALVDCWQPFAGPMRSSQIGLRRVLSFGISDLSGSWVEGALL